MFWQSASFCWLPTQKSSHYWTNYEQISVKWNNWLDLWMIWIIMFTMSWMWSVWVDALPWQLFPVCDWSSSVVGKAQECQCSDINCHLPPAMVAPIKCIDYVAKRLAANVLLKPITGMQFMKWPRIMNFGSKKACHFTSQTCLWNHRNSKTDLCMRFPTLKPIIMIYHH